MPYPDLDCQFLLYSDKTTSKSYQIHPSGLPDIGRLIEGRADFWINPSLTKEQKKKRLILGDWSSIGWPEYKVSAVRELLGKLLTDNFEIYMWQNGHLLSMNQDNLYLIVTAHTHMTLRVKRA